MIVISYTEIMIVILWLIYSETAVEKVARYAQDSFFLEFWHSLLEPIDS